MNQNEQQKQPFFARFLESQNKQPQTINGQLTDPWPVPMPTSPFKDPITDKYPSDGDDDI
jgi:hypothetical protein